MATAVSAGSWGGRRLSLCSSERVGHRRGAGRFASMKVRAWPKLHSFICTG